MTAVLLVVASIVAVLCIFCFLYSFCFSNTATARVGAAMVAFGVLFFSIQNWMESDWREIAQDTGKLRNKNAILWKEKSDGKWQFRDFEIPEGEGSDAKAREVGNVAVGRLVRLSFAMRVTELFYLFVGTLIWGFGDWLNASLSYGNN